MYKKILVPIDGSETADCGLREAIALASEQNAALFLLHVVDDYPMLVEMASAIAYEKTLDYLRTCGNKLLTSAKKTAAEVGVDAEICLREITSQRAADVIVEEAKRLACDLIVMGTHGRRGFSRLALGSDADLVVRASPVPVLLVRCQTGG